MNCILILLSFQEGIDGIGTRIQDLSDNFIRYVIEGGETYQIIQIVDEELKNDNFLQFITEVQKNYPCLLIDKKRIKEENNDQMPPLSESRASIFVIFVSSKNLTALFKTIKFIKYLCQSNARSKVLIIHQATKKLDIYSSDNSKTSDEQYRQFFETVWLDQFLDVTVLELLPKKIENNLVTLSQSEVVIHHYNPFTKMYSRNKVTSDCTFDHSTNRKEPKFQNKLQSCNFFPNKVQNLHNYPLIMGVFNYPPYVIIKQNSTGHVISVTGPDIKALNVLSESVSFTINYKFSNQTNWDKFSCIKTENIGITNQTIYNKVQMIALEGINFASCLGSYTVTGRGIRLFRYIHLVPILPGPPEPFSGSWQVLNLLSVIILLLLPWLTAKLLHFDIHNWQIINILQMVLGMSAPREPTFTVERIIFACLLISCFLESTYIFSAFSSSQLQMESFLKLDTFGDMLKTTLTPMIAVNLLKPVTNVTDDFDRLFNRTLPYDSAPDYCVNILKNFKNVSCVMRETQAQLFVYNDKAKTGRSSMKILNKEIMWLYSSAMVLAGGSPFRERFDGIILRLVQSGIGKKWDDDQFQRHDRGPSQLDLFQLESSQTSSIMMQLLELLIIGWVCSIIAFFGELAVHFCRLRGWMGKNY